MSKCMRAKIKALLVTLALVVGMILFGAAMSVGVIFYPVEVFFGMAVTLVAFLCYPIYTMAYNHYKYK